MKWLQHALSGVLLLGIIFFGLKSFVVTVWSSGPNSSAYVVEGSDGRSMLMIFMPKSEVMIWYGDQKTKSREGVLATMKGSYGTHYVGPIWRAEGPGTLLGWRWITDGMEPVHMEITILEKYREGQGDSAFPSIGNRCYQVIFVGKDRVRFQGTTLGKGPVTEGQILQLRGLLSRK